MLYNGSGFKMADIIAAARNSTADKTDISKAPNKVNPSPGDPNTKKPATYSSMDTAGSDTMAQQDKATNATAKDKKDDAVPKDLTYEKPASPEFPDENDPSKAKPIPKQKGFMESLIDAKIQEMMTPPDNGQGTTEKPDADYPKDQFPAEQQPKSDNTPERPKHSGFNPANLPNIPTSTEPSGKRIESIPGNKLGNPQGPAYKPTAYISPKAPKFKLAKLPKPNRR